VSRLRLPLARLGGACAFALAAAPARAQDLPGADAPTVEQRAPNEPPALQNGAPSQEPKVKPLVPRQDAPPQTPTDDDVGIDYQTPRWDPAAFPLIGGNSDIGAQFGGVGRITRFGYGAKPFVLRGDFLLTASVRDSGERLALAQQEYLFQIDIPNLLGGRVRTVPGVIFMNFVDAGYFGRGNASSSQVPDVVDGDPNRYYQQRARELRLRNFTRIKIVKPIELMIAPIIRFHDHRAYAGSKLAQDAAAGIVNGLRPVWITSLAVGIVIDTRDNEFFPRRGMYHQIGQRYEQGFPIGGDVQVGVTGGILAGYVHLGGPFVAAGRLVADFQYGKVPFYDLYNAGPFNDWEMPGGASGIRGVPWGRYSAPIKLITNVELRALHTKFTLLGQKFRLGNQVFFDSGRVWDDYTFVSPRDGRGLGLKWGAGAGAYVMWGDGALFRAEIAYSPDAVETNPRFPLGIYLADGVMF
jgi:hypothetical protein